MPILAKQLPPLEWLRNQFFVDPASPSGLRRISTCSSRAQAGAPAGTLSNKNYWRVSVAGKWFPCHRIIWSMANGRLVRQEEEVDHINGIRSDNRKENLRTCTRAQNSQNVSLGHAAGTYWDAGMNRWKARVMKDRRWTYAGSFHSREEAHDAYLKAKAAIHTFNASLRYESIAAAPQPTDKGAE